MTSARSRFDSGDADLVAAASMHGPGSLFGIDRRVAPIAGTVCGLLLSLLFLFGSVAEGPAENGTALSAERASNAQRIAAIDQEAAPTGHELQRVLATIDNHNGHKPSLSDRAAVAAFNAEAERLNQKKAALAAKLQALQDEQDRLIARNKTIDSTLSAADHSAVAQEQGQFDRMNAAWMRAQERLIREAVAYDSKWRTAVLVSLESGSAPDPSARPSTILDLLPGDILLLEPTGWSAIIPPVDRFYRAAEELARGQVFAAIGQKTEPVSHAISMVKRVKDVTLFLDHTSVGSRILDQKEFERLYRNRKIYVARPQTAVDGKQLWQTARDAALKHKSDYGVTPGKLVCSERAGIAVAKATGLDLQTGRLGPIDITPADFFDPQSVGKYFIISPLESGR
jgi:hypothetical protein